MDPYREATDHWPTNSKYGDRTRRPTSHPHMNVSWQSSNIAPGRDAIFNIITGGNVPGPGLNSIADLRTLANWVSPLNHHKVHKDILEKVTEGTGSWIFGHPKFIDWLSKKTNILWGAGIPGAGKTCLTSIVVEHLINDKQATVIYIYCQYNDQLSTAEILACMLKQMVEASEEAAQYVTENLHNKCLRTETKPSKSELLTTLRGASRQFLDIFFVVDALDELKDDVRPELINDLMSLQQPLFMTSRSLADYPGMKEPDFTIQAPDEDFRTYISTKISCFPKLDRLLGTPGVRDEIITKIHARCGGMFLLAALQVDALALGGNTTDARSLREAMEHLPASLDDQYDLTLKRIRSQSMRERDLAYRAIILVTYATSILDVDELLEALTVDIETASVDREWRTPEETLVGTCMGLLTIEKETKTVQLIHYTAQEFFKRQSEPEPSVFGDPHAFIANVSAVYLIHADVDSTAILSIDDLQATKSSYPFLYYACSNLGHHTCLATSSKKHHIPAQVAQLFRKRPNIPLPLTLLGSDIDHVQAIHFAALHGLESLFEENLEGLDQMSVLRCSPLFYACLGGHTTLAERILADLKANLGIGYTTKFGATALHAASRSGQLAVVKLVLTTISQHGSISTVRRLFGHTNIGHDVNTKMSDGRTALHLASENGYEWVVNALLSHIKTRTKSAGEQRVLPTPPMEGYWRACPLGLMPGNVDINAKDRQGRTPLFMAAQNGHDLVARLLLNSTDIEVNAGDKDGRTPLHRAAQNGHKSVAQLLLESTKIEVNTATEDRLTPLHLAVSNGHESVVQLLLNSTSIEFNVKAKEGLTPLHAAAFNGNESVAQLLLNCTGIELNVRGEKGLTPLHIAAFNGNEPVTRLLLNSAGIEVNPQTANLEEWTPLHVAAWAGHKTVAQLLLNSEGIEVNAASDNGSTPLHLAALNGHALVAQLLLNAKGIEVNTAKEGGSTPLHFAASSGHELVAQLLLDSMRIEVNARDIDGLTPLHLAAKNGHELVAQLLLNSIGIEVNPKANDGWIPLHFAALNGHESAAQLLLNSTAIEVNLKNTLGSTSLHLAASKGHELVAQLLLKSTGIEVNARDLRGWTPLHRAAHQGDKSVTQLLLNSTSIEVNTPNEDGWTPLHLAASNGHELVAQLLLKSTGIEVNARDVRGWTPLHRAAHKGHKSVAQLLLNSVGIEVNARDKDRWTPLHLTALIRHESVAQLLLNSMGIECNVKAIKGLTPLHFAASNGDDLVAQLLLNSTGIEVNATNDDGLTPLHLAASNGHELVTQLLLNSMGIEVNATNDAGWAPLHAAALNGHKSVAQLLLNSTGIEPNAAKEDGSTPLHLAAWNGHESVAQLLLKSTGTKVNAAKEDGTTPLHFAAQNGHEPVAQLLLNSTGIEVNSKSNNGWTPLHLAARYGQESVARLLLHSTDIRVNVGDEDGSTPLYVSASHGQEMIVRLLLGHPGIDAHIRGQPRRWDQTPLEVARSKGHHHIVAVFQEMGFAEVGDNSGAA